MQPSETIILTNGDTTFSLVNHFSTGFTFTSEELTFLFSLPFEKQKEIEQNIHTYIAQSMREYKGA